MTASNLLQELETLPHHARILRMVGLGRAATHDPVIAETLAELAQGDFYHRFLALHSCFGSYDSTHVLRAFTDPSRIIRGTALNLSVLTCNEDQLRQALQLVPRDGRLPLLWKLHHHGKQALIDEFLEQLAVAGDPQLRKLLPCGSPTLVRRFIQPFASTLDLAEWRRLARRHPALACELLQARAEAAVSLDIQLVACANSVLPILAHKQPDQALALVETLARTVPLVRLDLDALLMQRPTQLADLALRGEDLGELDFLRVVQRLDTERLLALIEKYYATFEYHQMWFPALKPETRLTLYHALAPVWRDRRGVLSSEIVALLPRAQREQEARRHLALLALATRPQERLSYAAFLPWDEAYSLLEPFLHAPSEQTRLLVFQTLTHVVRYERDRLPDLLALVCAHLHEPDPVRCIIVNHLTELPRSIWRGEHLDALEQLIQHIIDAFDTSALTMGEASFLILRVLECAPAWSATHLVLVAQKHGLTFRHIRLKNFLSDQEVRQIGPALRPALISWAEQGDEQKLLPLIAAFGPYVRVFDALLDALEVALNHHPSPHFGNTILATFRKHSPTRAARVIPLLLQNGDGKIIYPEILTYLHRHRQDLLTPLFAGQLHVVSPQSLNGKSQARRRGRRKSRFRASWGARLTSHQQALFAQKLLQRIHNETSDQSTIIQALTWLAALPSVPATHLIALASDERPLVRDTALMQLAKLENGEGIPALQEALHDERAVRALYALRPWFLAAPTADTLALLRTIPFTGVTLAKEVVRLLGELHGEEAYQELLALDQQDLHRDVRIAFLRALWSHLERDETWQILEREAHSADPLIALSTAHLSTSRQLAQVGNTRKRFKRRAQQQPSTLHQVLRFSMWNTITLMHVSSERLVLQAQQRLMHLSALLLRHPDMEVRAAVLRGCTRLAAADDGQELLTQLLKMLDTEQEDICSTAASAIFGTCVASDATSIGQAIERLLPNRQALLIALNAIKPELPMQRGQLLPVIRAVEEALAHDPLTIGLRVELAIAFLPWDEVASLLIDVAATGMLHADALDRACQQLPLALRRYGRPGRPDSHEVGRLEEALSTHADERLRRIALAVLIAQAALPPGWTAERRACLQVYRTDPSSLVAAAAQFAIVPPTEAESSNLGTERK